MKNLKKIIIVVLFFAFIVYVQNAFADQGNYIEGVVLRVNAKSGLKLRS